MTQKWEYLTLQKIVSTGGALIIRQDGRDIGEATGTRQTKYPEIHDYLNRLGEQGWQLAGVDQGMFIFMRPKQETSAPNPQIESAVQEPSADLDPNF